MGGFGITELLVVLAIVMLIFGTKKLKNIGSDLGGAIKGFKSAMDEDSKDETKKDTNVTANKEQQAIENDEPLTNNAVNTVQDAEKVSNQAK